MNRRIGILIILAVLALTGSGDPAVSSGPTEGEEARAAGLEASAEFRRIQALLKDARYGEAEELSLELLTAVESMHGPDSIEAGGVLDLVVESMRKGGRPVEPDVREFAERAVEIKEAHFGPGHPRVATSLVQLALSLQVAGDLAGAGGLHERALAIRESSLGVDHPDVAWSLNYLATVRSAEGNHHEAIDLLKRAVRIMETAYGPDDPKVAWSLNTLAALYQITGDYAEAEPLYLRSLRIRENTLGPEHADVAWSQHNLATFYTTVGDDRRAEALLQQSLETSRKALGPEHPVVASRMAALASLLHGMGRYAESRKLYEDALDLLQRTRGPEHLEVATASVNYADLLLDIGDYAEARINYEHALEIQQRTLGQDHPDLAWTIDRLAESLARAGDFEGALSLYQRALAIRERSTGQRSRQVAWSLYRIAELYVRSGDFPRAKSIHEEALEIRLALLGPEHPEVALSLEGSGHLYDLSGEYEEARARFQGAASIWEKAYGADHPYTGWCLRNEAIVLAKLGRREEALDLAVRVEGEAREHLRLTMRTMAEDQALRYASARATGLDIALSLIEASSSTIDTRRVLEAVIRSRAMVLDEMATRSRSIGMAGEPGLSPLLERYRSACERMANLMVRGAAGMETGDQAELLRTARREKEQAEQALAESSSVFREGLDRMRAGMSAALENLPPHSALVSFVHFHRIGLDDRGHRPPAVSAPDGWNPLSRSEVRPDHYAAFVVRSGEAGPGFVNLGPAPVIEDLVSRWSRQISRGAIPGGLSSGDAEANYREHGARLRRALWDPLMPLIGDADRVFIVPDGLLSIVSFASLPIGNADYLPDTGMAIHYLSAERDLIPSGGPGRRARGLLAIGGPAFDDRRPLGELAEHEGHIDDGLTTAPVTRHAAVNVRSQCGDFRSIRFTPLPAAARESDRVAALWRNSRDAAKERDARTSDVERHLGDDIVNLTGADASEAAFKRLAPGRQVLHLATHGFFMGGRCPSASDAARGIGGLSTGGKLEPPPAAGENPLLLSGIALAGANLRDSAGPGAEDGVLTAEEVAMMDLRGVEWAVLSACDTGIGEVKSGEGVFGLRRAFQIAGAGTLLMSLWAVEDEAAADWMEALYEERFLNGRQTMDAVRAAGLRLLKQRRNAGGSTHPFYWAGFVAAGDWR